MVAPSVWTLTEKALGTKDTAAELEHKGTEGNNTPSVTGR